MELAQPVERVREQEVAHLVAAEVEDRACPSRDASRGAGPRARRAPSRRSAPSANSSRGKCAGTQSRMTPIPAWWSASTSARKSSGSPIVETRRVEARHLVAPRARERVVHHRHELDVREAEVVGVGDELLGELLPAEPEPPRLGMHLVDRDRLLQRSKPRRRSSQASSRPLVARAVDPRGGLRRHLGVEGERIGLQAQLPVGAVHLELVARRPRRPRARPPPRSRRSPAARAAAPARPRGSSRRRPRRRAHSAPRPRTRRPRR